MTRMNSRLYLLLLAFCSLAFSSRAADSLERGFAQPPESTKPWCYWYWISDNISRDGITKDLEAMKRVGIREAFIGNIYLNDVKHGTVKALAEEWWGMVEHAIREGGRLGVDIGLFNCPGWSQSGGPWIKPEQAMRYVVSSEWRVKGPQFFTKRLTVPKDPFQDIALLAFPAPRNDADTIAAHLPAVICTPTVDDPQRIVDGNRETAVLFPAGAGQGKNPFIVDIEVDQPFTARSLVLYPAELPFAAQCELQAAGADGVFRQIREFPLDRSNTNISTGPMSCGPVAVSFPAQTARQFRLIITQLRGKGGLAEIELSGAARLERFVEKQLGKMHPTPLPMWDTYLWPKTLEPESPAFAVPPGSVVDLTGKLADDGRLNWDVPEGEWIILRTGMTPTGTRNAPASPEGQGLEVDKMNRAAAQTHFDAYVGKLLARMPKADRKAFKHVVADSYEMGSQNWTFGFGELFRKRYGYDPRPWLPVLTGRLVGSAEQSDRFLWDLRRLVADRIAFDYVGGLRDAAHQHGLKLWLENYGHWGYPAEFLQYGGQSDEVSGEFWSTGDLGSIELRAASSAAHTYGKPIVHAEAFTSGELFQSTPWSLKRRGDWALTEGINHWVLHVYIHQPRDNWRPGVNAWFSTEFNRHNTWFEAGREWIDYYRRCDFLLQQGRCVADIAYFIGEDTPKMTGIRKPALPAGYNFDYINAEVIEQRLKVKDGRFVLPDGMSYRLLVLPELDSMRPELLQKIRDLVKAGGTLVGAPPSRSPSLKDYPACDERVRQLAAELWHNCDGRNTRQTRFGKGRVFRGTELQPVLDELKVTPDFAGADPKQILWTHRSAGDTEIYFISNQGEQTTSITPVFRVSRKAPEFWDAVSGRLLKAAVFEPVENGMRVPLRLGARGSVFVVFREPAGKTPAVVQVSRDNEVILNLAELPKSKPSASSSSALPAITLTRGQNGALEAEVADTGAYNVKLSDGQTRFFQVNAFPAPKEISGPWEVRFPANMDVPERLTLDQLAPLSEHPNEAIKYFSGTASYERKFELPADHLAGSRRVLLDLGRVEAMAEVVVNGKNLGVFWKPPFIIDVTEATKPGMNELEVRVTGTWRNRLIGAAKYPNGFPGARGQPRFKPFLGADLKISEDEAPVPFGLIGPVRVQTTQRVNLLP